jgi:hypothetical protein
MQNYLVFWKPPRNAFKYVNVITSPKDTYGFSQTIKLPYNISIPSNLALDSPPPWHTPKSPITSVHSRVQLQYHGFQAIQTSVGNKSIRFERDRTEQGFGSSLIWAEIWFEFDLSRDLVRVWSGQGFGSSLIWAGIWFEFDQSRDLVQVWSEQGFGSSLIWAGIWFECDPRFVDFLRFVTNQFANHNFWTKMRMRIFVRSARIYFIL